MAIEETEGDLSVFANPETCKPAKDDCRIVELQDTWRPDAEWLSLDNEALWEEI